MAVASKVHSFSHFLGKAARNRSWDRVGMDRRDLYEHEIGHGLTGGPAIDHGLYEHEVDEVPR